VRIFQDIVINPMMLLEPEEISVILPGATRYETPGGRDRDHNGATDRL
jgi:hypothetical protein